MTTATTTENTTTLCGSVVWFDDGKGYGFIRPDSGGPDRYVHFKAIVSSEKRRRLTPRQRVQFEPVDGPKGPATANVKVID
jgi:CspA family cold shock protein